jgi:pyridoxine 5'-phosphate synthase PdxJ
MLARIVAAGQEIALLVEPEVSVLKEVSRAKAHWVFFSTETAHHSASLDSALAEFARIQSAAFAASKLGLRIGLHGPTGRQLPSVFQRIDVLEEVVPSPDLWSLALRLGWEGALREYRELMI